MEQDRIGTLLVQTQVLLVNAILLNQSVRSGIIAINTYSEQSQLMLNALSSIIDQLELEQGDQS